MKILLIGNRNIGKSTLLYSLFKNCKYGGIVCIPVFKNGMKIGTDAIDLLNNKKETFSRIKSMANFDGIETERYVISIKGLKFCIKALERAYEKSNFIIIDEFGRLEMKEEGIYSIAKKIIESNKSTIIVLRKEIEKEFLKKFDKNFKKLYMDY